MVVAVVVLKMVVQEVVVVVQVLASVVVEAVAVVPSVATVKAVVTELVEAVAVDLFQPTMPELRHLVHLVVPEAVVVLEVNLFHI